MFITVLSVSFVATFLSVLSGGGTGVINTPIFLWLGIPLPTTTALQKTASVFWMIPSGYRYLKNRKIDFLFVAIFAGIGLAGVWYGVNFVTTIPRRVFELVIGFTILFLVLYSFFKKNFGDERLTFKKQTLGHKILIFPMSLLFGLYEGFFGAGNGIFFSTFTYFSRGWNIKQALGYYFIISWLWNVYASYLFYQKGFLDLHLSIAIIIGSVFGALLGTSYGTKKSNTFFKLTFQIMGILLSLKLLIGI